MFISKGSGPGAGCQAHVHGQLPPPHLAASHKLGTLACLVLSYSFPPTQRVRTCAHKSSNSTFCFIGMHQSRDHGKQPASITALPHTSWPPLACRKLKALFRMSGGIPSHAQLQDIRGRENFVTTAGYASAGVEYIMSRTKKLADFNGGRALVDQVGLILCKRFLSEWIPFGADCWGSTTLREVLAA